MMPKNLETYWEKRLADKIHTQVKDKYISYGVYLAGIILIIEFLIIK